MDGRAPYSQFLFCSFWINQISSCGFTSQRRRHVLKVFYHKVKTARSKQHSLGGCNSQPLFGFCLLQRNCIVLSTYTKYTRTIKQFLEHFWGRHPTCGKNWTCCHRHVANCGSVRSARGSTDLMRMLLQIRFSEPLNIPRTNLVNSMIHSTNFILNLTKKVLRLIVQYCQPFLFHPFNKLT